MEAQDCYAAFKLMEPTWASFCTSEELEAANMEALVNFGKKSFTGGLKAFALIGAWQIAFRECSRQGLLKADENHPKYPARVAAQQAEANAIKEAAAFRVRVQGMSAAQMKEAARTEPGFEQKYAALTAGEKVRFY
ncbi:MAG: hypothetical protein WCC97_08460 [Candidatus Acidiferrales bacterium]